MTETQPRAQRPATLVFTQSVLGFTLGRLTWGTTAVVVMIGLGSYLGSDDDHVDDQPTAEDNGTESWP